MPQGFCRESSWVYKVAHEYDVENECRATWNGVSRCFLRSRSGAAAACNEGGGKHLRTVRSEEHTSELQSRLHLVCRLLLEKKKKNKHEQTVRRTITCSIVA